MTEALLVGVGQYDDSSFPSLSAPTQDVEALQDLLRRPDIGANRTADITVLNSPTLQQLRETIETFCTLRHADETVLIYFSGHAILNDQAQLFFPCRDTARSQLELTAYPLSELKAELEACQSSVIILDCCFSGTFAKDMLAPQDFDALAREFGSTRRALLTSPTSIDYSPSHKSKQRSTYTQILLDALETGMADGSANQPLNGEVNVTELHAYISSHLQEMLPALSPTLYAQGDGYKMVIVFAPYLAFRQQVISLVSQGEISIVGHNILQELQIKEGIPPEIASAIREDALLPHRQQAEKQRQYEKIRDEISRREFPLSDNTQAELLQLRQVFGLQENSSDTANDLANLPPTIVNRDVQDTTAPPLIAVEPSVENETPVEAPTSGNGLTQFLRSRRLVRSPDPDIDPDLAPPYSQERTLTPELLRLGLASLAVLALFGAVLWALFQPFGSKPQFDSADGWFNEGIRKAQAGDRNAAIDAYTQAINLSPTPANRAANLYYNRGIEYASNGNVDQAISDYSEAIRLDPALADAYFNRANLTAKRNDRPSAIKDYRNAARLYQQQNNRELQQSALSAIRTLQ